MNTASIGTIFHTPEVIAWAGDWHANYLWARKAVRHAKTIGATIVIHTGDFGYDYKSSFIQALQEELAALRLLLLFVRGNHDNPEYLDALEENEHGFKPLTANIWYIPQGHQWTWGHTRFLGLGGAHSIDRPRRVEGVSWWPGETISGPDAFKAAYAGRVDVMITHDCPAGVSIPGLDKPSTWSLKELALSHRHRERLYEVVRKLRPSLLIHGHFHTRYTGFLDIGAPEKTRIVGLDCDESTMVGNMAFSRLEDFKKGDFNAVS